MLEDAEKFATADQEKRKNIDLKNQAEALCFEAEKELSLFTDNIDQNKKQNIEELIKTIRQETKTDNSSILQSKIEELKTLMKDIIAMKTENNSNSSNLNDL